MRELINKIITNNFTLVTEERFDTIIRLKEVIDELDGDIIECGVLEGGMGM